MADQPKARLTVFSDYVCPFCYLEEPELARIRRDYGEKVEVDYRAYELRPYPVPTLDPDGEYLHRVWNSAVYPMANSPRSSGPSSPKAATSTTLTCRTYAVR